MTYRLRHADSYVQFLMFASSTSFSAKAASLHKMAILLWYLAQDLNLLGLLDRNVGLTAKVPW